MSQTDYSDIIYMNRPVSLKHPRMSNYDRAAQFAPFAALTGHEEAINETARLTDRKAELDEETANILNEQISIMRENIKTEKIFTVTFFIKDRKKDGGRYNTHKGSVRNIDDYNRTVVFSDEICIPFDDIIMIES